MQSFPEKRLFLANHSLIEIKTLVILRMLFAYKSPESIRTDECSRISILFFCYSEQFIANFISCFLQFSFGLLCMALVRSNELQVNNESFQSSVRSACSGLNFSNRTESKQCENKLSSKQRNPNSK